MRNEYLPDILRKMPTEVQNGIREVRKKTSTGNGSSGMAIVADKLFLLSEIEIFGSVSYSKSGEGTQYAYYKMGGNRLKNYNGSTEFWWERSPSVSASNLFCIVSINGGALDNNAGSARGVSFAFCF